MVSYAVTSAARALHTWGHIVESHVPNLPWGNRFQHNEGVFFLCSFSNSSLVWDKTFVL